MRYKFAYPISGRLSSVLVIALLASVSSACSSGVSRFNENPFSNPFQARYDQTTTGSIKKTTLPSQMQALPSVRAKTQNFSSRVTSSPLPAPHSVQAKMLAASNVGVVQNNMVVAKDVAGWSAKGGTPVTLGAGETINTVANRYGVPASALLSVNGLSNSSAAVPGQRLVIPTYNATSGAVKKLGAKSLTQIDMNPLNITFSTTYYAFSDTEQQGEPEAIDPTKLLGFAAVGDAPKQAAKKIAPVQKAITASGVTPQKAVPTPKKAVSTLKKAVSTLKKVRAVSSIAAPISIKGPKVAVASPKSAVPVKVAAKPGVKAATKPVILAAAPKKQIIRTVEAKPSIVMTPKPLKQVADNPATTSKVAAKPKLVQKAKAVEPKLAAVKLTKPKIALAPKSALPKPSTVKVAVAKPVTDKTALPKPKQVALGAGAAVAAGAIVAKTNDVDHKKFETVTSNSDSLATGSLPPLTSSAETEDKGLFRWPVRGRVISSFGAKELSGTNNGINIAVPDGTPVKAAEAGTVAYAGDDVKKYGKLVLIKHENGYVSAYAHNGELSVKKGDIVKRGQVVAKSGATGDVASPQLHFQLRKGEQPMDPSKFLDAG